MATKTNEPIFAPATNTAAEKAKQKKPMTDAELAKAQREIAEKAGTMPSPAVERKDDETKP